jgi:hypothetical protein
MRKAAAGMSQRRPCAQRRLEPRLQLHKTADHPEVTVDELAAASENWEIEWHPKPAAKMPAARLAATPATGFKLRTKPFAAKAAQIRPRRFNSAGPSSRPMFAPERWSAELRQPKSVQPA